MNYTDDNPEWQMPSASDIESTRRRVGMELRRPLWARVLLGVGYSLPFFAAAGSQWWLIVTALLGFLVLPSALTMVERSRTGMSADILSATKQTVRIQFVWAIVMIALLTVTIMVAQFGNWTMVGYIAGVVVLVSTPFALRAVESLAVRGLGKDD